MSRRKLVKWGILVVPLLVLAALPWFERAEARSESPAPPEPSPTTIAPEEVVVGVFLNQIYEISLKENFLTLDFYLWFRWKTPELKPYSSFAIVDGRIESKGEAVLKDMPDGSKYAYLRVVAKVTKFWDIRDYPLDNHTIDLIIEEEDQEDHAIQYAVDQQNSELSPNITVPGWKVSKKSVTAGLGTYKSNFGDLTLGSHAESRYGRVTLTLDFQRDSRTFFVKVFFSLWIAAMISFLTFFIKVTDVDPRFGLGVGALFAAVASQYVVSANLPETSLVTLADKIHGVAFAFIFVVILQSTISLWLFENEREAASKKLDKIFGVICPILYVAINLVLLGLA